MALYVNWKKTHDGSIVELTFNGRYEDIKQFTPILKGFIPASHRTYDPSTKIWEIAIEYWLAIEMAATSMNNVYLREQINPESTRRVEVPKDYADNFFHEEPKPERRINKVDLKTQLELLLEVKITTQPIEELKKIYRRKAMQLHPDRNGGDASRMSELNSVWSEYTK